MTARLLVVSNQIDRLHDEVGNIALDKKLFDRKYFVPKGMFEVNLIIHFFAIFNTMYFHILFFFFKFSLNWHG